MKKILSLHHYTVSISGIVFLYIFGVMKFNFLYFPQCFMNFFAIDSGDFSWKLVLMSITWLYWKEFVFISNHSIFSFSVYIMEVFRRKFVHTYYNLAVTKTSQPSFLTTIIFLFVIFTGKLFEKIQRKRL